MKKKGKLGLEKGKKEEKEMRREKMGLEPSLYTLEGNKIMKFQLYPYKK